MNEIPKFKTKTELTKYLLEHKDILVAEKKANVKHADSVSLDLPIESTLKTVKKNIENKTEIEVQAVLNTTNLIDSHMDLHVNGIWNKTLGETKLLMHLQEHQMKFDKIISDGDDLAAYVKRMTWKSLGYDLEGSTEALMFDSKVRKSRNEYMFEQYAKGNVKNHSVGMRYVKLLLAINDDDAGNEFEIWEKYYPNVANKDVADDAGYFWVVKEAKLLEGSAVPIGSNYATPTLSVKSNPLESIYKSLLEPVQPLEEADESELSKLLNNIKF